jgi:hypothetical protein
MREWHERRAARMREGSDDNWWARLRNGVSFGGWLSRQDQHKMSD